MGGKIQFLQRRLGGNTLTREYSTYTKVQYVYWIIRLRVVFIQKKKIILILILPIVIVRYNFINAATKCLKGGGCVQSRQPGHKRRVYTKEKARVVTAS